MEILRVKNWESLQHYKDRSPPWIKLHRDLLRDYEFSCLQDASKLHLMLIWLLASQLDNKIPNDPPWIQRQIGTEKAPDIKLLIDIGFLYVEQVASSQIAERKQSAMPETEAETETEAEKKPTTPTAARFGEFWEEYPRKVGRKRCLKKWKSRKLDRIADTLIADVRRRKAEDGKWLEGFVPNPETYINGDRWEDEIVPRKSNGQSRPGSRESASTRQREAARRQGQTPEFADTP